eukprot:7377919-Prymnesium_polylepis.1
MSISADAAADEDAGTRLADLQAAAKSNKAGLSHGSLSAIHSDWKAVFQPDAAAGDAAAAVAAERARLEGLTVPAAKLTYKPLAGVITTGTVTNVVVEEVAWSAVGSSAGVARVTFEAGGEPLEELIGTAALDAAIAAAGTPAAAATTAAAATAAAAAAAAKAATAKAHTLPRAADHAQCQAEGRFLAQASGACGGGAGILAACEGCSS